MTSLYLMEKSLLLSIWLSFLPLAVASMCGVMVSLILTVFQIQDQSLPMLIKFLTISLLLYTMGAWIKLELINLFDIILTSVQNVR